MLLPQGQIVNTQYQDQSLTHPAAKPGEMGGEVQMVLPASNQAQSKDKMVKEGRSGDSGEEERKSKEKPGEEVRARFRSLVDLVHKNGRVQFLVKNGHGLKLVAKLPIKGGQVFIPPSIEQIPFDLLNGDIVLGMRELHNAQLYYAIADRLRDVSVLPTDAHYHLCAVFVLFTYLEELVSYYPYLWFFGLPERGKSRIVKVLIRLSYRGFYTETLNEAYIFRFAHHFGGTLGLDVVNLLERAKKQGSHDLLLGRFEEGMRIPRVVNPEKGPFRDTQYYTVAGPTILATNRAINESDPLYSRCIRINMPDARGIYPNHSLSGLEELRACMLRFRARHMNMPLPDAQKPVPGRLGDLMQPLLAVAALLPQEATDALLTLTSELEVGRKEAETETWAGKITTALWRLQNLFVVGKIPVEQLRIHLNQSTPERYQISSQQLGHELSAIGIKRKKVQGVMWIIWEPELMGRLFARYDVAGGEL